MMRYLIVLFLTVFQDNYVRLGTIVGLIIGFSIQGFFNDNLTKNVLTLGFIGWGVGVYLAFYFSRRKPPTIKNKFKVFEGGR